MIGDAGLDQAPEQVARHVAGDVSGKGSGRFPRAVALAEISEAERERRGHAQPLRDAQREHGEVGRMRHSVVGMASTMRLMSIPFRRSISRLKKATARPEHHAERAGVDGEPHGAGVTRTLGQEGIRACAANRSTTVKKAVSAMTKKRSAAPAEWCT